MKSQHTTKKNSLTSFIRLALALVLGLCAGKASAQIYAQDDAASYTGGPNNSAWLSGANTNGGFGFMPWVFLHSGPGFQGFYVGTANGASYASTNGHFWGMYDNTGVGNSAVAFRAFSNSIPVNTVFKIKWHPVGIGSSTSQIGGFALRNGNANASTNDFQTGARLFFYFAGGGNNTFSYLDANGANEAGVPFQSNPLQIEVTLESADTYRLVIKDATGANTLFVIDNQPLAGSGTIDSLSLFAFDTTGDQIFNNVSVSSTSLVPPDVINLSPTNGTIYAPTNSLSFEVTSAFSTVSSNGITLLLNGVNQSNHLAFAGSGTSDVLVTNTTPLQPNVAYIGAIIARDANGNFTTNNFSFNTWLTSPANIYVEAEDYNYTGGHWIDNFLAPQPNQQYSDVPNDGLLGSNNIDYLEFDLSLTHPNFYRTNDYPQVEVCTDLDHNNFAANTFQDYNLAFIQNGEWEDYTRRMSNVTYTVSARMAGFGGNPTMLMERLASLTVNTNDPYNQPRAALGTFVSPQTGGSQNWTFVQLKDFFSNPVQLRLPGTNTFRLTDIGGSGSYNVNYLILVATTNTATLRPYLASGYPYPGVGGVQPDQNISFTIANRQTSVTSVQLLLNSSNVTATLSNNAAGMVVSYQSPALLPAGTNTVQVIFTDSSSVLQTNSWQFYVASLPVLPPAWALPVGSFTTAGFTVQVAKADDSSTNIDFPPSVARAESQLSGTLTNSITLQPYANQALNGGNYTETNVINYAVDPTFYGNTVAFSTTNVFPNIPAGGTNDVAMAAQTYVQLAPGVYTFAVYSDDGFQFTAGPTPANTNMILGIADYGRGPTESSFAFIVQTNGLYPMRLLYFKAQFNEGGVQLYSINRNTGIRILLNDPNNVNSLKTFQTNAAVVVTVPPTIGGITISGGQIIISGTNNVGSSGAGGGYHVLTSTNMAQPLASWAVLTNGTFDANGNFSSTNATGTGQQRFYILQVP